jgi:hypothetical protein
MAQFNLAENQRAERKLLLTVAEWKDNANGRFYVGVDKEPADWNTSYSTYFTKSGDTYSPVSGSTAPAFSESTYYKKVDRELLGKRTEDSSIEYNPDIATSTDILGNNYTDMNKTQPEQSFDPHLILGGARLAPKMDDIRRRNALSEVSQFTVYVITAYVGDDTNGYAAERQDNCTITYDSLGGDTNVNFPITVHYSNEITLGTVDKLGDSFEFTPTVA